MYLQKTSYERNTSDIYFRKKPENIYFNKTKAGLLKIDTENKTSYSELKIVTNHNNFSSE